MTTDQALSKIQWAVAGVNRHPTSCSQYWKRPDSSVICDCGLWEAMAVISDGAIGRMLRQWDQGHKPR